MNLCAWIYFFLKSIFYFFNYTSRNKRSFIKRSKANTSFSLNTYFPHFDISLDNNHILSSIAPFQIFFILINLLYTSNMQISMHHPGSPWASQLHRSLKSVIHFCCPFQSLLLLSLHCLLFDKAEKNFWLVSPLLTHLLWTCFHGHILPEHILLWTVPSWWYCQENHQQILTHSPSPFSKYSLHGCFLKWPFVFWKHLSTQIYVLNKDNLLKKTAQASSVLGPNLCLTKPQLTKLKKHTFFAEQSCWSVQENLFSFSVNQIQKYKHSKHTVTLMQYFVCTIIWLNYCPLTKEYQSHSQTVLFHTFRIKRLEKKPNILKALTTTCCFFIMKSRTDLDKQP